MDGHRPLQADVAQFSEEDMLSVHAELMNRTEGLVEYAESLTRVWSV